MIDRIVRLSLALLSFQPLLGQTTLPIIPAPAQVSLHAGSLNVSRGVSVSAALKHDGSREAVAYLEQLLAKTHGPALRHVAEGKETLVFATRPAHGSLPDESYALDIDAHRIRIEAASQAGFFYGTVSLWQMLDSDHGVLPAVKIEDGPRFRWRGLMLDSARHLQSEDAILRVIDEMARHKLNVFHWHLTDDQGWRVEIKRYPRLTTVGGFREQTMPSLEPGSKTPTGRYGGFFTQEQIRHIVAYARDRSITIVPEIEMPGHASAALAAYPEFGSGAPLQDTPVGWGIYPNLFHVNDATFAFLENVLTEVMELFPSQYIHVGGDEAVKEQWKSNPAVQAKMRELGLKDENEMQSWFTKRIETFLNAHGRKLAGWDEILEGGLSPDATVMSWRGTQGAVSAAHQGHDAILTPNRPLYFNYRQSDATDETPGRDPVNSLADVYNFEPAPGTLTAEEQGHILGLQGSIWSEYILTEDRIQHMLFPRAAAVAEVGWSPAGRKNFADFLHRLPADMARSQSFGVVPAQSVFEVRDKARPVGEKASLDVTTQGGIGVIRYTLDGKPVSTASPAWSGAQQLALPITLRAQAFDGATPLGTAIERHITLASTLRRDSRELDACNGSAGIQMEQDPPRNAERPVFRVVYSHPCWLYRDAELDRFAGLSVGVGSIPYIFRSQQRPMVMPTVAHPEDGLLEVRLDSCKGDLLTRIRLAPAYGKDGVTTLTAEPLAAVHGTHTLCFAVQSEDPNRVWLLNFIQPVPKP
jgi:hexosaminidase